MVAWQAGFFYFLRPANKALQKGKGGRNCQDDQREEQQSIRQGAYTSGGHDRAAVASVNLLAAHQLGLVFRFVPGFLIPPGSLAVDEGADFGSANSFQGGFWK